MMIWTNSEDDKTCEVYHLAGARRSQDRRAGLRSGAHIKQRLPSPSFRHAASQSISRRLQRKSTHTGTTYFFLFSGPLRERFRMEAEKESIECRGFLRKCGARIGDARRRLRCCCMAPLELCCRMRAGRISCSSDSNA